MGTYYDLTNGNYCEHLGEGECFNYRDCNCPCHSEREPENVPSDAEMAQADYETRMDEKADHEASNSAQAESEAQAEYESSPHKDCLDKSKVKQAIEELLARTEKRRKEHGIVTFDFEFAAELLKELGLAK